jgi:succinate dehydrogenase (ubiquinone) cytochrome b560 subunit
MLTLKTLLAFPFVYHSYAGLRHLVWDTGRWLTSSAISRSGYALILLSLLTAFGVASL